MFLGFSSALSGVQAGSRILGASAHNIANAQTENFKRTRTTLEESSAGRSGCFIEHGLSARSAIYYRRRPFHASRGV